MVSMPASHRRRAYFETWRAQVTSNWPLPGSYCLACQHFPAAIWVLLIKIKPSEANDRNLFPRCTSAGEPVQTTARLCLSPLKPTISDRGRLWVIFVFTHALSRRIHTDYSPNDMQRLCFLHVTLCLSHMERCFYHRGQEPTSIMMISVLYNNWLKK